MRRWGREYGGFVAAGVVAVVVLICSATALSQAGVTWHEGTPVAAESPSYSPSPAPSSRAKRPPSPTGRPVKRAESTVTKRPPSPTSRKASPAPALRVVGPDGSWGLGRMLNEYCQQRFNRYATLTRRDGGATNNWACVRRRGADSTIINMMDACVFEYGPGTIARYTNAQDPFSWRCYRH